VDEPDLSEALDTVERYLLGDAPTLTRLQVCEQAGVPVEVAEELWRQLGFPHQPDDAVAFTQADVRALECTRDLVRLGILSQDRQAALVRTWGRSFARLAEWQTRLLTDVALESPDPVQQVTDLASEVLPRVEALQGYVWRRHLASAGNRLMASDSAALTPPRWPPCSSTSWASPHAARSSPSPSWCSGSSTSRPSAPASWSTTAAG
jgi:adenylate cyclase